MFRLKNYVRGAFVDDDFDGYNNNELRRSDERKDQLKHKKLFPDYHGLCWSIVRGIISSLFYLCHIVVAIVFISFFISSIAFFIAVSTDLVSEMISPSASTAAKRGLLSTCLFFQLCSFLILASFILSLFWGVLKAVVLKTSLVSSYARVAFLCVAMVASGTWVAVERYQSNEVSFVEYVEYTATVAWVMAFVIALVGSVFQLIFVYNHSLSSKKCLIGYGILVLLLLSFGIISPISFGFLAIGADAGAISLVVFLPFLGAAVLSYGYFRGRRSDWKGTLFNARISALLVALLIFTVILALFVNTPATCKTACKIEARTNAEKVDRRRFSTTPYQICSKRWSTVELNIAELAFFANLTYNPAIEIGNATAVLSIVNDFFFQKRNLKWTLENELKPSSKFLHMQHKDVHVVGIRGPVTKTEFAESARLWNEIASLQSLNLFVPIVNYFSVEFLSQYVAKTSFIDHILHGGSNTHLFEEIENHIKKANQSHQIMFVGHSYGGGVAKILGARLQKPAISFSSPGVTYSHVKFGFSLESAEQFLVSISPRNDYVTQIDKHTGLVQNINCDGKTIAQCHLIVRTYCELHNNCGLSAAGCQAMMDN